MALANVLTAHILSSVDEWLQSGSSCSWIMQRLGAMKQEASYTMTGSWISDVLKRANGQNGNGDCDGSPTHAIGGYSVLSWSYIQV